MSAETTVSNLNGFLKNIYGDRLESYLPNITILQKFVGFEKAKQIGKQFSFPVLVQGENGVSYGSGDTDAYELNAPSSLQTEEAAINGSSIIVEGRLGYVAAAKAKGSKTAFESIAGLKVKELTAAVRKSLEISLWAGQKGLGTATAAAAKASNGDGTYRSALTLNSVTTAPGFWVGSKGMRVVLYKTSDSTAKGGYGGTVARTTPAGVFTVRSYNPATNVLTVSGAEADIDTLIVDVTAANCTVYRYGTVTGSVGTFAFREMAGLEAIATNAGSLFGIDAAANDAWAGTVVTSVGAISVAKVIAAVNQAFARGFEGDMTLFVNPDVFAVLAASNQVTGARSFDQSYQPKFAEIGVEGIVLHALNGKVEVVASTMCKLGQAFGISADLWSRIGAVDFTMADPAGEAGSVFFHDPTNACVAYRGMSHQALVCKQPMKGSLAMTGITLS